jgi:hypothetical protein
MDRLAAAKCDHYRGVSGFAAVEREGRFLMSGFANFDIGGRSALQLGALISAGLISAEEVAERTLAAIADCEDQAIFTHVTRERALREARAAAERLRDGRPASALDGVPIAWKDLFDLQGMPTTAGSRVFENAAPAVADAPVVSRLQAAGMVCVGRVNMTEFAFSQSSRPPRPQSSRRIVVGLRRCSGARPCAGRHRHRHRRFGAHPRGVQWRDRLQGVLPPLSHGRHFSAF